MHRSGSILRAGKADHVQVAALLCEAEIGCGVGLHLLVGGKAGLDFGRPFAIDRPGFGAIDGLAVAVKPCAHLQQDCAHLIGNSAIRARSDAEQQIAILADSIDKLVNDGLRRLEFVVLHVAPGEITDGGSVCQGRGSISVRRLRSMTCTPAVGSIAYAFEGDHSFHVIARGEVIIKSRKFGHPGAIGRLGVAAVKVEDFRLVFID